MAGDQKFMFDYSFDDADEIEEEKVEEVQPEAEVEIEEIVPTFSEEDLAAARREGFDEGKLEGVRESRESAETNIAAAMKIAGDKLSDLFAIQIDANQLITKEAVSIAASVAQKMFPSINELGALTEIANMTEEILGHLIEESRVDIFVNETLADDIRGRISNSALALASTGEISVIADPNIALGDCRVTWGDGMAERNAENLSREIDAIVERAISSFNIEDRAAARATKENADIPDEVSDETGVAHAEESAGPAAEVQEVEPSDGASGTPSEESGDGNQGPPPEENEDGPKSTGPETTGPEDIGEIDPSDGISPDTSDLDPLPPEGMESDRGDHPANSKEESQE